MPKVTVVMPMHNGLPYIREAIESIIQQTLRDWELLVVDDLSIDGSPAVVSGLSKKDSRIKLIQNNSGIKGEGAARNVGINNAIGEYIAMMDADDISLPNRLEIQVAFMDAHQDIVMSGCNYEAFGDFNQVIKRYRHPYIIRALLLFDWGFNYPTIIFRRLAVHERYNQLPYGTDFHFCTRVALSHKTSNIPEILYRYRIHKNSVSFSIDRIQYQRELFRELLPLRLGFIPTSEQIDTHLVWLGLASSKDSWKVLRWFIYILRKGKINWTERVIIAVYFFYRGSKWIIRKKRELCQKYY